MSRPITPGQTVPVPFTLSETPDSLPTLTVYQSTAAGVLSDVSATTSPTVTQLGAGLDYHAYFTVPVAAAYGSSYQLLASVTIAGETTTHWLDGGTVLLTATTDALLQTNYALKADVRAWSGREDAVALDLVFQRVPGGVSTQKFLPYVSGNVCRFEGVPAEYFLHENPDGTVVLHSHVHGMSEDSGIASQASVDALSIDVDAILAKVNLIKSGVNVQFPFVNANGTMVLFEGFDYTDAGNAAVSISEAEVGQFDATRMAMGEFRFYMRSRTSDADYFGVASAVLVGGLYTLSVEIESEDLPTQPGTYDWWFMSVASYTGTGTDAEDLFGIVYGQLELRRGMKLSC